MIAGLLITVIVFQLITIVCIFGRHEHRCPVCGTRSLEPTTVAFGIDAATIDEPDGAVTSVIRLTERREKVNHAK